MHAVLILGGYGNFGSRISKALAKKNIPIIIAGRDREKATQLMDSIHQSCPKVHISIAIFDVNKELSNYLSDLQPKVVINTCGPFQLSDYSIAEICIKHHIHYIDLADGRDFVNDIVALDKDAKANDVLVISGASTVPGLSSAVLEHYKNDFSEINSLVYGISPGQKAPRGLATTKSILTYLGKPLKQIPGVKTKIYGWQDLYRQPYPGLGKRWMANCDIPDLDIFPNRYNIKSIRFSAGMENSILHLGMWSLSWFVRLGLPIRLHQYGNFLLRMSNLFNYFGTADGGMHILLEGKDKQGNPKKINWFIIAKSGDGPEIPCVPAIVLAKKIMDDEMIIRGAMPCVAMVTLDEYMNELKEFDIKQVEVG